MWIPDKNNPPLTPGLPYSLHPVYYTMHIAPCTMQHALCSMHYATCTMQHALCSMRYAACTMQHALGTSHFAYCTMHVAKLQRSKGPMVQRWRVAKVQRCKGTIQSSGKEYFIWLVLCWCNIPMM